MKLEIALGGCAAAALMLAGACTSGSGDGRTTVDGGAGGRAGSSATAQAGAMGVPLAGTGASSGGAGGAAGELNAGSAGMTAGTGEPPRYPELPLLPRPNILLAIADDQSYPHASVYGAKELETPGFDRIARAGILFHNAFVASPGCSPSRAALLTGRHTWMIEQAGTHASSFPAKYQTVTDVLRAAGYFVGYTGKGWGPGVWNAEPDPRASDPVGTEYRSVTSAPPAGISPVDYAANFEQFLEARPDDQPFLFWFGADEPHRPYKRGLGEEMGKNPANVQVPAFLPDTAEVRSDLLDYYAEIEWFDQHLMRMLSLLEQHGELDDTIVIVTSDNGMPFPRGKANNYEQGIHVPLAIAWPRHVPGQRQLRDMISFVDLAPTLLQAAGASVPDGMVGLSMLNIMVSEQSGFLDPRRVASYSARERHSSARYMNWGYPIRSLRTADFLYVRNFRPERWPAGDPTGVGGDAFGYYDIDDSPSKALLFERQNDSQIRRFFELSAAQRPEHELFDLRSDPAAISDVAANPAYATQLQQLKTQLETYLQQTQDTRVGPDGGEIWESYPRLEGEIRTFPAPN